MAETISTTRFAAVLGMLDSRGEQNTRLIALDRAEAMLKAAGKTWADLADAIQPKDEFVPIYPNGAGFPESRGFQPGFPFRRA